MIVWTGASEPAAVVVVALTAARLGMAVIMGAGLRWAWFVAVAMELVVIAFIVFTSAVTGVATAAQLLVFVPLGHPALARRDSWVHRWG